MLTAVPLGMGTNPRDDMDVCKCIVPSQREGALSRHRAASLLVRFVEGEERWKAPNQPQYFLPQNWGENELNRSVTCMVLKNTASPFAMMNFVGLDLAFVDQMALVTANNIAV
ncbi:uncharacterized protein TNCV_3174521 [Trichonephila clavipes]|nr:uncharacterized protein TNCV_3174521 [Trichonephila clavipes]